jgi:hypothetical protein
MSIENAAKSFEDFLKKNIDNLKKSSLYANVLRKAWLDMHPEYQNYDLQLDIEWQDSTNEIRGCLDGCCPWVPPKAKSFRVFPRNWEDERYISNKTGELKPKRSQVAAAREDLQWDCLDK